MPTVEAALPRLSIFALLLLPSRARIVVSYILSLPLLRRGTPLVVVCPVGGIIGWHEGCGERQLSADELIDRAEADINRLVAAYSRSKDFAALVRLSRSFRVSILGLGGFFRRRCSRQYQRRREA
jgi:hypothetical protein